MNNRIPNEIDGIAAGRLMGCVWRVATLLVAGGIVAKLVLGQTPDRATRAVVACAVSGFVFGFAGSLLAVKQRRVLTFVFVLIPIGLAIGLFFCRTILGMHEQLPLRLALSPLAFAACFVAGQVGRRR